MLIVETHVSERDGLRGLESQQAADKAACFVERRARSNEKPFPAGRIIKYKLHLKSFHVQNGSLKHSRVRTLAHQN